MKLQSNFMTTAAGRKRAIMEGYVGWHMAISQREVSQDYRIGGGERLATLGQGYSCQRKNLFP